MKKSRTVDHLPLDNDEIETILSKIEKFGDQLRNILLNDSELSEVTSNRRIELGEFPESKRRAVHVFVNQKYPYLQTITRNENIFVNFNQRSFVKVMQTSDFNISCRLHQLSPFNLNRIEIEDKKFEHKDARKAFIATVRSLFSKMIDFKYLSNGKYEFWVKEKKEKRIWLVKIKRIGLEHNEMIAIISRILNIKKDNISYSGTKDAKAIVTQYLTIAQVEQNSLNEFRHPKIEIISVKSFHRHLQLGELVGNRFTIRLDSLKCPKNGLKIAVENVTQFGFVNYFGLQRYGLRHEKLKSLSRNDLDDYVRSSTPIIGLLLITGYNKLATVLSLSPNSDSDPKTLSLLEQASKLITDLIINGSGDQKEFLKISKQLHPARKIEIQLLQSISKNIGEDNFWERVWSSVAYRQKQFYVQSGNSLLWNRAVSRMIRGKDKLQYLEFLGNNQNAYLADLNSILKMITQDENVNVGFGNLEKIGLGLSTISGRRKTIEYPSHSKLAKSDTVIFCLPKSSYATMFLREISGDNITQ